MRQVLLTTNDAQLDSGDNVRIRDLGIGFTHPTTDFNLSNEESIERLRSSTSLKDLIDSGDIILTDDQGKIISNISEYLTPQFVGEAVRGDGGRQNSLELFQIEPYDALQIAFTADAATAKYKIQWSVEICLNKNNKIADVEITLDGMTKIAEFCYISRVKNKFESICGFSFQNITSGNHTIEFKVSAEENGVGVTVRRIAIEVEKK